MEGFAHDSPFFEARARDKDLRNRVKLGGLDRKSEIRTYSIDAQKGTDPYAKLPGLSIIFWIPGPGRTSSERRQIR